MHKKTLNVYRYCINKGLIYDGIKLIVGVSGGADSVCLLRMLAAYREMHPFSLTAVHIHHGIRGEEAEEDARFCEALARELQLPFLRADCDVPKEAAAGGISLEEAGRLARYRVFGELLAGEGGENARVALAHHMDDAAETLLLNLLRGSGPLGAASMRAVRGPYIRPLLVLTRQEIETYLALTGAPFRTDSTNLADDAARNRLRHHVLPYLQAELNGRSAQHLAAFAEKQEALADFFCAEAEKRQGRYLEEREDGILVRDQLFAEELPAMRPGSRRGPCGGRGGPFPERAREAPFPARRADCCPDPGRRSSSEDGGRGGAEKRRSCPQRGGLRKGYTKQLIYGKIMRRLRLRADGSGICRLHRGAPAFYAEEGTDRQERRREAL